jgi:Rrf2 family nitric oxide-sensitive transcriptional repressor
MRLSLHTDFALRTLMFLAVSDGNRSIAEIAKAYGISKNHLMKVAQRLVVEGFVEAKRGRSGGLQLARPASQINVGVVVRAIEDPATNTCVITPVCGLRHALSGAVEAFSRHLDQFSIADMIGDRAAMRARLQ